MSAENSYRKLIVYQRMLDMVVLVYRHTKKLPSDERFGLVSQMRRASVSVVSNFVEGYLKSSRKEKLYYLETSVTSLHELEAQYDVCEKLGHFRKVELDEFFNKKREVGYLLFRYKSSVAVKRS